MIRAFVSGSGMYTCNKTLIITGAHLILVLSLMYGHNENEKFQGMNNTHNTQEATIALLPLTSSAIAAFCTIQPLKFYIVSVQYTNGIYLPYFVGSDHFSRSLFQGIFLWT